MEDEAERLG